MYLYQLKADAGLIDQLQVNVTEVQAVICELFEGEIISIELYGITV